MTNEEFNKLKAANDVLLVKQLGERLGYGHLMDLASALWRKSLKEKGYPTSGAFVATIEPDIKKPYRKKMEKQRAIYDELVKDK